MSKRRSPSFVLSLELRKDPALFSVIANNLEICRVMYNTVLGSYLKLETQMKRERKYKKYIRQWKAVSKKLEQDHENPSLIQDKKHIEAQLSDLRKKYQLTEYASHHWVKPVRQHFGNRVNAAFAQKTVSRAWFAFREKLFGKAQKVHFIQKGKMKSFEGKTNDTGWRYIDRHIVYKDLRTSLIIKKHDAYAQQVISAIEEKEPFSYTTRDKGGTKTIDDHTRVKYVRIVQKKIRGKIRYFADLVINGYPPSKGKAIGKGRVGLDIGTSSLAVSSLSHVSLVNLAEDVQPVSDKIRLVQRKMDRSKRAMNPENYHADGTIKRGMKTWVFSKRYHILRSSLKALHRKQAVIRKQSHQRLANEILGFGNQFNIETMNFKALHLRKKETTISAKTGKYIRKRRFGKTIGHRAPAMFVSILEEKAKRLGGSLLKVNTHRFKASQYCHQRNTYVKKPLSERWHRIDEGICIQRDLYAAFLLMNSNAKGTKADRKKCLATFDSFKRLHNQEVRQIVNQQKIIFNSGIRFQS
ncbi:RNA-guided endonuclease TnpB family protein [Virgibacillus sp. W0181]|uniref:RNA-guided endonuclease TnpB family protein n=1 Tax=Virgibacillus sp. W0181 TaxID=3391581 RepID=UPI003F455CC8